MKTSSGEDNKREPQHQFTIFQIGSCFVITRLSSARGRPASVINTTTKSEIFSMESMMDEGKNYCCRLTEFLY